jgi:hypothetical protein
LDESLEGHEGYLLVHQQSDRDAGIEWTGLLLVTQCVTLAAALPRGLVGTLHRDRSAEEREFAVQSDDVCMCLVDVSWKNEELDRHLRLCSMSQLGQGVSVAGGKPERGVVQLHVHQQLLYLSLELGQLEGLCGEAAELEEFEAVRARRTTGRNRASSPDRRMRVGSTATSDEEDVGGQGTGQGFKGVELDVKNPIRRERLRKHSHCHILRCDAKPCANKFTQSRVVDVASSRTGRV